MAQAGSQEKRRYFEQAVLYEMNLVMQDSQTGSWWHQIRAEALAGPDIGTKLTEIPLEIMTWAEWREQHPNTTVILAQ